MSKISEPIVFFGSGPVAAKSLQLLAENLQIEAVITKPRPLHHRGSVPVIDTAGQLGLTTYFAENKATLDALCEKVSFASRLAILIDFGIIVSQTVINTFPLGIVNSHFSLLPQWRGADPITFAILSGQKETGVSLMLLTAGMDEGPLIGQASFPLGNSITNPELTTGLIQVSNDLLLDRLPDYLAGQLASHPQDLAKPITYSRKLTKADGELNWNKPAAQLEREVRAFTGWPKSRTKFHSLEVIILQAHVVGLQGMPGETAVINKKPVVYCEDAALELDRLQPAGKKEMSGQAFLAGYRSSFLSE